MPPAPSAYNIVEGTDSRTGSTGYCSLVSTISIDYSGAGNNSYYSILSDTLLDSGTCSTGCCSIGSATAPSTCDIMDGTNSMASSTGYCSLVSTTLLVDSGASSNGSCSIGSATVIPDTRAWFTGCYAIGSTTKLINPTTKAKSQRLKATHLAPNRLINWSNLQSVVNQNLGPC